MNDDFERDDPLRRRFEKAAGPVPGAGPTILAELRPRMERSKRRRRAAIGGSLGAVILVVAGSAVALRPSDRTELDLLGPGTTLERASTTSAPTSVPTTQSTATTRRVDTTTSTTAPPPTASSSTSSSTPTSSTSATTSTSPTTSSTSTSTSTRPPVTTLGPTNFSSRGGTVTVRQVDPTTLKVLGVAPQSGWNYTIEHDEREEVEVRFRRANPEDEVRLRIRIENGVVTSREDD